ncbi:hypothetical protein R1flu_014052 [Riccia fluitans]|uniref:Uncharacterized protein n=1 Tax=Riccia fluitans TaxID=41844 RepID=A0ABD1YF13_9MARC
MILVQTHVHRILLKTNLYCHSYVSDCNLTGPVPDYVQKWAQVNVMELQNNHFTSFPSNLSGCESLHVL